MIQHDARFWQFIDYAGIKYGNCRPSDIDGIIEFKGKAVVLYEAKYKDKPMPMAQRLTYERIADALNLAGIEVLVIVGRHDVDDPSTDVDFGNCYVRNFYWKGRWHLPEEPTTVNDMTTKFLDYVQGMPKKVNIVPFLLRVIRINQAFRNRKLE